MTSTFSRGFVDTTRVAAADYSTTGQFLVVAISGTDGVSVTRTTTDGQRGYGILENSPTASQVAEVCSLGPCKARAGAAVTAGQLLKSQVTTSRVIPIAANADYALAMALEDGVDGDVIEIMIVHAGINSFS